MISSPAAHLKMTATQNYTSTVLAVAVVAVSNDDGGNNSNNNNNKQRDHTSNGLSSVPVK
jgi:hypothetical protein